MPLITISDLLKQADRRPDLPPKPEHVNLDPAKPVVGPQTVKEYVERLQAVCLAKNLPLDYIGTVWSGPYHRQSYPLYRVTIRRPAAHQSPIAVVSGLHGDERGAPLGVLDFLENRYTPDARGAVCPVYPIVNPWGFDRQRRPNGNNIDINRTFGPADVPADEAKLLLTDLARFTVPFLYSMHEDGTNRGFYLYNTDSGRRWLAERMIECATRDHKLPRVENGTDYGGQARIDRGLISYTRDLYPSPAGGTPIEDLYLDRNVPHICIETPMQADLTTRLRCHSELLWMAWSLA